MKVLHGPTNVGNQACSLSHAERTVAAREGLAFRSVVADFFPGGFSYKADKVYGRKTSSPMAKARRIAEMMLYGLKAASSYDVFHLYFGRSFMAPSIRFPLGYPDISIMKKRGKKCFMTFQGCDARLKEPSKHRALSACHECTHSWCDAALDAVKRKRIAALSGKCARIFCLNPDLVSRIPGAEFLPYCVYTPERTPQHSKNERPLILHAPTDRKIKGTQYILEAFASIQASFDVDCVLVENLPHSEALALYQKADLVVDQLMAGWYGGVAVEVMQMGIPVVGFICEEDLVHIPHGMKQELPIIRATAEDIFQVLANAVADPEMLRQAGAKSRSYVERWHNPLAIAKAMIGIYEDDGRSFWDEYGSLMA